MKINSLETQATSQVSHNQAISKQVLVSPGEIPGLTNFSQACFPPGEIAGKHSHADMTEVFFVIEGEGLMIVDEQAFSLKPGMSIVVEPGESHEIRNTGSTNLIVSYFGLINP